MHLEQAPVSCEQESESSSILDPLLILARQARLIVCVTAGFLSLGILAAFVLRPTFVATATILPPQQAQSSIAMILGQLGSLGGASSLNLKTPADLYVGMLKSQTIANELIQQFHLKSVYKQETMVDLQKRLASNSEIEAGKDGLIHIGVTDHDPARASAMANAYVDALYHMTAQVAVTESAQRRMFFDQRVEEEKQALTRAEDGLRAIQQKTGVIQLSDQTAQTIHSIADLRAEVENSQRQLETLLTADTDQNPDVIRARRRLEVMKGQLAALENSQGKQIGEGDITLTSGRLPADSLEYIRQYREVNFHNSLYELLLKQSEAATLDEAKSAPMLQLVDRALPPDKKSGPHRLLLIAGSGLLGLVLSSVWILLSQVYQDARHHPRYASRFEELSYRLNPRVMIRRE